MLVFPGGQEAPWKRSEAIAALQGNAVRRIQASQSGFWLYVANRDILWIGPLFERHTERPFLHWEWTV